LLKIEQKQLFEEIYHLQNCELALGEYYQQLASLFYDQRWFWEEAVSDEVQHARQVGKLIAMIASNPTKYSLVRYRVAVLETYLNGIYGHIEQIKNNKLSQVETLKLACDYEVSSLETKPFDIISSSDPDFIAFKNNLAADLVVHSKKIRDYAAQKIAQLSNQTINIQ
jgi:hypothetical protein